MTGGLGDDVYVVDDMGDRIIEGGAALGFDTVRSLVDFRLSGPQVTGRLERLELTGNGDTVGIGNQVANDLRGNDGNNLLEGRRGADRLAGAAGDDTLSGGAGNDRFVFDLAPDGSGLDLIVDFDQGEDRILLSAAAFGRSAGRSGGPVVNRRLCGKCRRRGAGRAGSHTVRHCHRTRAL